MGGFGSGRQGGKRTTGDMLPLDIRKIQRAGLLMPGRSFGWQWTRGGEKIAAIKLRTDYGTPVSTVTLDYRTTDRVVVLHLPGQPQRLFKLRLAANPGHSDQFGPWHLDDRVTSPGREPARELNDAFAIRYRVL